MKANPLDYWIKWHGLKELTPDEKQFVTNHNNYRTNDKPDLSYDEGWLTFNNSVTFDLQVYYHNQECWKCDSVYLVKVPHGTSLTVKVNTTFWTDMEIRMDVIMQDVQATICRLSEKFRENGDYWLFFNQSDFETSSCDLSLANDPASAELPILYVAAGIVGLWIIVKIFACVYRKRLSHKKEYSVESYLTQPPDKTMEMKPTESTIREEIPPDTHSKRQRLHSLDTFRGLSLLMMIFINYGGGGYWFFDHPPWNGITIADLVFPWFVFIMGVSMNFSFRSMLKRRKSRAAILWKVVRRSALLFAFGIVMNTNWGPVDLRKLRIPGVLQRLSLCYLLVAAMETVFATADDRGKEKPWAWCRDVIYLLPEWLLSLSMLAVYLALTFALPVPGCPTGYIGPGGLHEGKTHVRCTGGAAGYIDRLVLGDSHIYGNPTPKAIYQTEAPYDPEGILGTLSAAFLCFLGLQAGRVFMTYQDHRGRLVRLVFWALVTGAIGAALCNCSKNDGIIPLNKNLWSVSFSLVTACFGYFLLAFLYVIVDILQLWGGEPFIFAGMNPLILYLCHDIFYRFFPVNFHVDPVHWKLLLKALWDVIIWLSLAFVLYCKKIFIAL
ncbi:heparan-alpha-glucosaminide N-acetyltransferase-like isoform X2 [Dreissena polymorpha]|uniref:heparan-alpha-glucosaminide N-acetyltransferase-like isoform X2 n=1 Tax=Dreissena polymorpha TaxID=45954 RepID=UPI0022655E86|nr:heparan-alpha-glucosaminide N-acetyltransferase-like isoform X2 [Dreissena polymorpha]